jgi:hypothetical protein
MRRLRRPALDYFFFLGAFFATFAEAFAVAFFAAFAGAAF